MSSIISPSIASHRWQMQPGLSMQAPDGAWSASNWQRRATGLASYPEWTKQLQGQEPYGTTFLHGKSGASHRKQNRGPCFSRSVSANLIMLTSYGVVGSTAVYDFTYGTGINL